MGERSGHIEMIYSVFRAFEVDKDTQTASLVAFNPTIEAESAVEAAREYVAKYGYRAHGWKICVLLDGKLDVFDLLETSEYELERDEFGRPCGHLPIFEVSDEPSEIVTDVYTWLRGQQTAAAHFETFDEASERPF